MEGVVAPSVAKLVQKLADIAGRDDLPLDVRLADLGVDSMDVLEWLFVVEGELGVEFDEFLEEGTELAAFGDSTLSELVEAFMALTG